MLAAMFSAAGYKTGLYTSPHLLDYRERIRINGRMIPSGDVVRLSASLKNEIEKNRATFFEATTAMAFQFFADSQVEMAIVETGLGGRLDATNVLRPVTTAITCVGLEHTDLLGDTLKKIASEKAGIIKKGIPCVSGVASRQAENVIRRVCLKQGSVFVSHRAARTAIKKSTLENIVIDVRTPQIELQDLRVSLAGDIQARNVAVALLTLHLACSRSSMHVSNDHIRDGLSRIQELSGLQARLSVLKRRPLILADTAHNPQAISILMKSLTQLGIRKVDLVFGVAKDKDYTSMVRAVRKLVRRVLVVSAKTDRALRGGQLEAEFKRNDVPAELAGTVAQGVKSALQSADKSIPILVTGSNFVVGEALAFLEGRKYLTINQ